jgi:D-sedoheptulose 7-phosphate isomerase
MNISNLLTDQFKEYNKVFNEINVDEYEKFIKKLKILRKKKNKLFLAGNGGSSSIASHVAVDFLKNCAINAQTFNEYNLITCFSNDYGYEKWLEKSLQIFMKKNDYLILISSSGESKNIINAAKYAKKKKLFLITFSGMKKNNSLSLLGNLNFWINSKKYNTIENSHQILLTLATDIISNS